MQVRHKFGNLVRAQQQNPARFLKKKGINAIPDPENLIQLNSR